MNLYRPLFILAALLGSAAAVAAAPCQIKQVADLEPLIDPGGAVYLPVSLNGHQGYMALQLSSGLPNLFGEYVDDLELRDRLQASKWNAKVGGQAVTQQATVNSTLLGRINFAGWEYQINPRPRAEKPLINGKPLFGVMTSAFMNVVDLELNLGAGRLKLFSPNQCRGMPVYWEGEVTSVNLFVDDSGLMIFPIEVEGKRIEGSLNTNTRLSTISSTATRRYFGFDETSPGIERVSDSNGGEQASFRAMSLTSKGLEVRNARVRIKDMPACSRLSSANRRSGAVACADVLAITPFSVGTDLMKQLRIYVSVKDSKIYFTRAGPAAVDPAAPVLAGEGGVPGDAAR
jgi:hypothetical protein